MKFKLAAALLCAAGIAMPAVAGDAEDVKATIARAQAAYNACDVDTLKGITRPDFFGFTMDGTLTEGNDLAEFKENCDAGTKYNFKLNVTKVYVGDGWAVAAGQNTGTITRAGQEEQQSNTHFTSVLVKDGDGWKSLHVHASPNIKSQQ